MFGGSQFLSQNPYSGKTVTSKQETWFFPLDHVRESSILFKGNHKMCFTFLLFLMLFKVYSYLPSELTLTSIREINETGIINFKR